MQRILWLCSRALVFWLAGWFCDRYRCKCTMGVGASGRGAEGDVVPERALLFWTMVSA